MIPIFNRGHVFSSCLDSYVVVVIDVFVNSLLKLDCKPLYLIFQFFDPLFVLVFGHSWVVYLSSW